LDPLRLLSLTQAARVLGVDEDVVAALIEKGHLAEYELPGREGGRKRYTSRLAIEAYLRRGVEQAEAVQRRGRVRRVA
jgi:hypothetical protein